MNFRLLLLILILPLLLYLFVYAGARLSGGIEIIRSGQARGGVVILATRVEKNWSLVYPILIPLVAFEKYLHRSMESDCQHFRWSAG
jgi:hypothetical protein